MIYDKEDRKILKLLQGDLPLVSRPFQDLALSLNITEADIIEKINKLQAEGTLRRCGAIVRHHPAGYVVNAMVAWKTEGEQAESAGNIMAGFKEISHCYLREVPDEFGYNMFSMIHAHDNQELMQVLNRIAEQTELTDYIIIKSLKEFKKASMEYIIGED